MFSNTVLYSWYSIGALYICFRLYKFLRGTDTPPENTPLVSDLRIPRKSTTVAYLLLLAGGGAFGAHHVYLGNYACSLLYAWTIGLCGAGPLYDFFTLWYQVRCVNKRNQATGEVDAKAFHLICNVMFKWLPLASILTCVWWTVLFAFTPALLDTVGVVDLYAARAGMDRNPFDVLEVPRQTPLETAKKSFRTLSLKYHPDRNPNCAECASKMADLNTAYDSIKKADEAARSTSLFDRCLQDWKAVIDSLARDFPDSDTVQHPKPGKKKDKGKEKRKPESSYLDELLDKIAHAREKYSTDEL